MSSNATAQPMTVAPALPLSQQDDAEVMLQMFAAFGSLYESAGKIHNMYNQDKMTTLDAFYGEANPGKASFH